MHHHLAVPTLPAATLRLRLWHFFKINPDSAFLEQTSPLPRRARCSAMYPAGQYTPRIAQARLRTEAEGTGHSERTCAFVCICGLARLPAGTREASGEASGACASRIATRVAIAHSIAMCHCARRLQADKPPRQACRRQRPELEPCLNQAAGKAGNQKAWFLEVEGGDKNHQLVGLDGELVSSVRIR
jgi:hypothetical protein